MQEKAIEKIRQVHFLDGLAVLTALLQRQAMRASAAQKSACSDNCDEARLDSDVSSEKEAAASPNSQRNAADAAVAAGGDEEVSKSANANAEETAEQNVEKTAAASAGASVQWPALPRADPHEDSLRHARLAAFLRRAMATPRLDPR